MKKRNVGGDVTNVFVPLPLHLYSARFVGSGARVPKHKADGALKGGAVDLTPRREGLDILEWWRGCDFFCYTIRLDMLYDFILYYFILLFLVYSTIFNYIHLFYYILGHRTIFYYILGIFCPCQKGEFYSLAHSTIFYYILRMAYS